jgi:glycosyltransferase involved in cell wall biosynthesis
MAMTPPLVTYVLPDKVGGVTTIVDNLLRFRQPDQSHYQAVLTFNCHDHETRYSRAVAADSQITFDHALPVENIHAVARRLLSTIGSGPGVLVCNDALELMMVNLLDPGKTVVQILHGDYDYYYDLATRHEPIVHAFVAYSRRVYENLVSRLPHRRDAIFWLPYGVVIPEKVRVASSGPLRVIYAGRLDEAKGVLDLPAIDDALVRRGTTVEWTIVGNGPAADRLWAQWARSPRIRWVADATSAQVVAECAEHDVFVLPSRAEGLSVATVEAMSAGVVPVVTRLPSMAEIVDHGRTGLAVDVGDVDAFADAIAHLDRDRRGLETLSVAARALAVERFDIRQRAAAYQQLYSRWRELYRPRPAVAPVSYGSRLDQWWLPNPLVRLVRSTLRARLR